MSRSWRGREREGRSREGSNKEPSGGTGPGLWPVAGEAGRDCALALGFTGGATPRGKQGGFLDTWGQLQPRVRYSLRFRACGPPGDRERALPERL